ncbi:hypothetical protein SELMODRAFT_411807 [Selaginella moellendorffii]|uniref:Uncharacterized protein n=1 Tax=Selaginella moellendorffii TaxID=88036 RepID=D8RJ37_SELML|nr:hypothetical protein SELMODRAFT_411807 [Selaginella moellendorffii]
MGCGASKESAQSAAIDPSPIGDRKKGAIAAVDGECSDLRGNGGDDFDCDPGDDSSAAARASKAVSLIVRTCSPERQSSPPRQEEEEEARGQSDEEEEEDEGNQGMLKAEREKEDHHGDLEEDGSSETIVSPSKSPDLAALDVTGKDCCGQGVDDILPKAAAAALEAIVKSAEDDVQAMKVVAAVAAVGDILFGGKEETETKIEKCQTIVKTLAEVDANTINGFLKPDQQNFRFPGLPANNQPDEIIDEHSENENENIDSNSPKSSFLFDYCQKLNNYRISPPSTASASSSEADTLSMVQDFLEEIDLTKDYVELPPTPKVSSKSKNSSKIKQLTFSDAVI